MFMGLLGTIGQWGGKKIEEKNANLLKDIKNNHFNARPVLRGNESEIRQEIEEATKDLDRKYSHRYSPQVTAVVWTEIIWVKVPLTISWM
jgi:hypothetical protein